MDKKLYKWFYDNIHSKYYDFMIQLFSLPFGGEKIFRTTLLKPIQFRSNEKILDMCCGTGGATLFISQKANRSAGIIGIDLSRGQLKRALNKNYGCPTFFAECDASCLSILNCMFDKVFITHAIHEMPRSERLQTLKEAKRVLKSNGELIILELDNPPNFFLRILIGFLFLYWLPGNFETVTRRDLMKHGLINEMAECGFAHVRKFPSYKGILQTAVGIKNT